MNDEIAHAGVVDTRLRFALPGVVGGGVVRIDADNIKRRQIGEANALDILKFAAEDQMKELRPVRRGVRPHHLDFPVPHSGAALGRS